MNTRTVLILIWILQVALQLSCAGGQNGLHCASCEDAISLEDCDTVDECYDDEVCYIVKSSEDGDELYNANCGAWHDFCEPNGDHFGTGGHEELTATAAECCNTSMCNLHPSFASVSPPPTRPTFQLSKGVECEVCVGGNCGLTQTEPLIQCPDDFPYCMNIVQNGEDGNKYISKRCESFDECNKRWWQESSKRHECTSYDGAEVYRETFECSYCCQNSGCNRDIVPQNDTLLLGTP